MQIFFLLLLKIIIIILLFFIFWNVLILSRFQSQNYFFLEIHLNFMSFCLSTFQIKCRLIDIWDSRNCLCCNMFLNHTNLIFRISESEIKLFSKIIYKTRHQRICRLNLIGFKVFFNNWCQRSMFLWINQRYWTYINRFWYIIDILFLYRTMYQILLHSI